MAVDVTIRRAGGTLELKAYYLVSGAKTFTATILQDDIDWTLEHGAFSPVKG